MFVSIEVLEVEVLAGGETAKGQSPFASAGRTADCSMGGEQADDNAWE